MFEATISTNTDDAHSIDYMAHRIRQKINGHATLAQTSQGSREYLCIACNAHHASLASELITDTVADVLTLGYKNTFFSRKLKCSGDLLDKTLVNVMCLYDNSKDKKEVLNQITAINELSIDGLYNFRAARLRQSWEEVINLTSSYGVLNSGKDAKEDFLAYLVDSVPPQFRSLSVTILEKGFTLQDNDGAAIMPVALITAQSPEEELLLYNLVCHKGKQIKVYGCYDRLSKQCKELTEKLFKPTFKQLTNC